ncbi:MAG: transglycosylase SLT domain-containing protein [Arcobacter sp.]|uniref:transglycosylase SLT domain-containing protein n=1 Tax=Arcobacter sp. TaxID=1872629 RepID=UPI0025851218|nr:transglycosylase SLT domain-containing protein [Arcobacter sp.]MDD3008237.1 transglycosylase SLT domain-containing protein [Arcobacter sp.]
MKKILLLIFCIYNLAFSNSLGLTNTDLIILKKIKSLTDDKMMKYTLMAIAIKESSVGKKQVNDFSNDYGLFQSNIKSVLRRQYVEDNDYNRRYFAYKLLNDVAFSTANAIVEIDYWREIHKENWVKVWASYNAGWRYNSNVGVLYANSIFDIIKKLRFEYNL